MHPCTEFGVASSKFTFTGGPHVKASSSSLARAAAPHRNGTPMDFKLVQYACDLRVWVQWLPPFVLEGRANFLASLDGAARATCHVLLIDPKSAPSSFRRIGESNGASPVTIAPAVLVLFTKVLGHTNLISEMPQPNSFQPTHYASTPMIKAYARASALLSLEAGTA